MKGDALELKRDAQNGMLIGPDGVHYENEKQVFHFGVFGMCGCGEPEEAYNFLLGILKLADRRACNASAGRAAEWVDLEAEVAQAIRFDPETTAHVLLHLLTERGVIEHGGSVGGSWLTDLGAQIVDAGHVTTELDPSEVAA
jgi:hypothetical protein